MPQLAVHQLRVGAVCKIVAENFCKEVDVQYITKLGLVHDMGNIVKFDLQDNIDRSKFGQIENLKYWQGVQRTVWEKYGKNAHEATIGMLVEARLTEFVPFIKEEERLYFAEAREEMLDKASTEAIILLYGDCRVTPSGVVSYRERVNDLQDRYGARNTTWYDWTFWFEEWMQKQVSIDLNSITEDGVKTLFDELLTYTI